jgi:hypothetical protein
MESDATTAEVNGISFVDTGKRPFARTFFEDYGTRACVVNGIEVRSITHERCRRIMMTGSAEGATDDWGALLAGKATGDYLLPYFVMSGTAFTADYTDRVVRVGTNSQLNRLLSGESLTGVRPSLVAPSAERTALVDAYVRSRHQAAAAGSPISASMGVGLDNAAELQNYIDRLNIGSYSFGCYQLADQVATVWDVFELGLARTALLEYRGWCSEGWDTHTANERQSLHFDELFDYLARSLADLDTRVGPGGNPLAEEVVVVVYSEMGRTPQYNSNGGRDHWTFTSAMVLGAGVRGGQVVGGYDESGYGEEVDFSTGEVADSGQVITAAEFGATLLALGDVDPGVYSPIPAVLDE